MAIDPTNLSTSLLEISLENESVSDAGAVKREYFEKAIQQILDPEFGLFIYNSSRTGVYPLNRNPNNLKYYQLLGRLFARLIIDRNVAKFDIENIVLKVILGRNIKNQDYKDLDEVYYEGLMATESSTGEFTFYYEDENEVPLNSKNEIVTKDNVGEFIDLSLKKKYKENLTWACELMAEGL